MKIERLFIRLILTIVILFSILNLWIGYRSYLHGAISYNTMMLSDWFINYEGGFVRRGLTGQILLLLYRLIPHPVTYTILFLYFSGFIALLIILFRIFKKEGWSPFIIFFPICTYISFLGARRDYIVLVVIYFLFREFARYLNTDKSINYISSTVLSVLLILIHEATFFIAIPILILITYNNAKDKAIIKKIVYAIIRWSPALITMGIVCIYKGDIHIASVIWESWEQCFTRFPIPHTIEGMPPMGSSIEWLSYNTDYALNLHIHRFWLSDFVYCIPSFPFTLYTLLCTYYLVTNLNTITPNTYSPSFLDCINFSNILILQFFFLAPMFGFLSCDFGRVIMYWTISSIYAYHFNFSLSNNCNLITKASKIIQQRIKTSILKTKLVYLLAILTIPIAESQGSNILSCFAFIPYGWRISFWEIILPSLPIVQ